MAGLPFIAESAEQALLAATVKSIIRVISPTNIRVKLLGWGVYFDGVSATEAPVEVRVTTGSSSTAGTFATTLGAPDANGSIGPLDGSGGTIASTAYVGSSAEPTVAGILDIAEVHPQGGFTQMYEKLKEPVIGGDSFIIIECTAPAAVNVRAKLICEE